MRSAGAMTTRSSKLLQHGGDLRAIRVGKIGHRGKPLLERSLPLGRQLVAKIPEHGARGHSGLPVQEIYRRVRR